MTPITPAVFERMPWHAKARLIAQLDAEITRLTDRRDALQAQVTSLTRIEVMGNRATWDADTLRKGHAAYNAGVRTDVVCDLEREYDRRRKAERRAGQPKKVKPLRLGVDPIVVERLTRGDCCRATTDERRAAVAQLAGWGFNDSQIAERVGCSERTVLRDRKALGVESRWVA